EAGLKKVILLNHDVVVDETWENFIKAIDSDTALYGPLSNLPGGGDGNRNPQKSRTASFEGLLDVDRLIGFCLGFTLGKPELKLFDDWRFFNPEQPFGGNEFGIQKQMKSRSATTRFYVVTDTWVFHHLNMGWKDKPRFLDPYKLNLTSKSTNERSTETRHKLVNNEAIFHTNKTSRIVFNHQSVGWKENPEFTDPAKEKHTNGMTVTLHNDFKSQSSSYVVSSNENNISHIFRREVLPLIKADLGELSKAMLYIIEDGINKKSLNQRWRLFILSKIFYKVAYISATDAEQKTQLSWLKTEYSFNHHDFIDYSPNNDFI
ncbi:MAG: hypothetical protein GY694_09840, partial [Gammaproteobacteria bacterium]|nr:hypothetical protein [Gammaproteobacteria bacterium]